MSEQLKQFDAYAKTLDDFRIRTTSGGLMTIVTSITILVLFTFELNYFLRTERVQLLFVDTSDQEKLNISIDIRFPRLTCNYLTVDAMDVSGESQTDIIHNLYKTRLDIDGKPFKDEQMKVSLQPIGKQNLTSTTSTAASTRAQCESCYGAESSISQCCSTCDDVKFAYRTKGWSFNPSMYRTNSRVRSMFVDLLFTVGIHQCVREGKTFDSDSPETIALTNEGCRIHGHLEVNKVAGNFHIAPGQSFEQQNIHIHSLNSIALNTLNTTHWIDELSFGEHFPQQVNPLSNTKHISHEGAILYHYYVKIVPSVYVFLNQTQLLTNQYSVTKHRKIIRNLFDSSGHQLPGTFFTYEISAITVKFIEQQRSWIHFVTSLCAIIVR
jgi:endoplasmic reticulum-Golgi intermediate compartment protein 3